MRDALRTTEDILETKKKHGHNTDKYRRVYTTVYIFHVYMFRFWYRYH